MMRFTVFSRFTFRGRRWFWHLQAANGKIIAQGQSYGRKEDTLNAVQLVRASGQAEVEFVE
jgi:uncharacterized protein YegP (UPF0339 family)